jgi:hypothetical protein
LVVTRNATTDSPWPISNNPPTYDPAILGPGRGTLKGW